MCREPEGEQSSGPLFEFATLLVGSVILILREAQYEILKSWWLSEMQKLLMSLHKDTHGNRHGILEPKPTCQGTA